MIGYKLILQLFSLLPLINWMGVALVTQFVCMPGKDVEVDAILAIEGGM